MDTSVRPTEARISFRALASNVRLLREAIGPRVAMAAVVKADAYGHGAARVARLLEGLGVWGFGVATVEEGRELRQAGVRAPVLVMGAAYGQDHEEVVAADLIPMVGVPEDVALFSAAARRQGCERLGIHVKVDTGMTRLGVTHPEVESFLRRCAEHANIRVDGLATHFACADGEDTTQTEEQLRRFVACLDRARALGADPQLIHAANSAGALRFPAARFDLVRPGIVLYGAAPSEHVPVPGLRPVLSLRTRINALRHVPAGTAVSYSGTFVCRRPSIIATLPVGYADGYSRALSNRAQVLVRGRRAPLVGTVCMDLCMVDVTDVDGVAVGDRVTLLGGDGEGEQVITPEELAGWAGTISYEVLAGITRRVPRVYPEVEELDIGDAMAAGGL